MRREAPPRRGSSSPAFLSRWISQPFSARVGGGTPGSLGRSPLGSAAGEAPGPLSGVCAPLITRAGVSSALEN